MKISISKEWLRKRALLEEGLEVGAGGPLLHQSPSTQVDFSRFPIKEMYKRNWFRGFTGSLSAAVADADALIGIFVEQATRQPLKALQRQRVRSGSQPNQYALLAWQCRVLQLAQNDPPAKKFDANALDEVWLKTLVQLSRLPNGPVRAIEYLSNAGIAFVIEPHLTSTHLDGAALLTDDYPVVGLTLRRDRLDNFWFVLLHEIIHIMKHLKKGSVEDIFDEGVCEGGNTNLTDIEREADELAGQALIPNHIWELSIARFARSESAAISLASELKISPSIVAGRIRHEADNWVILRDLVGQGELRKLFPEVKFGE